MSKIKTGAFKGLPENKFGVVLADPPWSFKTFTGKGTPHRTEEDHYKVMSKAALEELPVAKIAAKDCALFMWVVDSNLPQALELAAKWGFTYKTIAFTWIKLTKPDKDGKQKARMGMGYWTRKQTELCLLFTKGKPPRMSKSVRQLIKAQRREHSRKPDQQYERIEALVSGPYIELFARTQRKGWTSFGNQTDKFKGEE